MMNAIILHIFDEPTTTDDQKHDDARAEQTTAFQSFFLTFVFRASLPTKSYAVTSLLQHATLPPPPPQNHDSRFRNRFLL
jgi:hypothetical protein